MTYHLNWTIQSPIVLPLPTLCVSSQLLNSNLIIIGVLPLPLPIWSSFYCLAGKSCSLLVQRFLLTVWLTQCEAGQNGKKVSCGIIFLGKPSKKNVKRVTLSLLGLEPTYPTYLVTWNLVTFVQKLSTYLPQGNSDVIFP